MTTQTIVRLAASGLIAFISYALWAYYANSLVTDNSALLYKAALVQGTYSGAITLIFTLILELSFKRYGASTYCLPLLVPRINSHSKETPCCSRQTIDASLSLSEEKCKGKCLPGIVLSPLPALLVQTILVVSVNLIFATPNLWLTIAPSILFSALYGYAYSIGLARKHQQ